MKRWTHWLKAALALRCACSRMRSFLWFITCIAGMTVRIDLLGVTSIVRALGLTQACYDRILDFFHGTGVKLDNLSLVWTQTVLKLFPHLPRVNGRLLLVGDGIKTLFYHGAFIPNRRHPGQCANLRVCSTAYQLGFMRGWSFPIGIRKHCWIK